MPNIPASDRLGTIMLDGLVNVSPGVGFALMLLISPVGIWMIRLVIEGRMIPLRDEFRTFLADAFLAVAFGLGLVLVHSMDNRVYVRADIPAWVALQVFIILAWTAVGIWHMWREREHYTWGQRLSPTALYHNGILYVVEGYVVTMVCGLGSIFAPWSFDLVLLRLAIFGCVGVWMSAWFFYDAKHLQTADGFTKFSVAHIDHGWPWQHKYAKAHLSWWWDRFRVHPGF
jgi:hypothetical protein